MACFADRLEQHGKEVAFEIENPESGVIFILGLSGADFPCLMRWILYNPDQQVAAFVPASARPKSHRAAEVADALQRLPAGESKRFHVNTGIKES